MNLKLLCAIAAVGAAASLASAAPWVGNIAVSQVDSGGTITSGVGYTVRLRDYSATTAAAGFNQSFAFNSGASGTRLVLSGSATSEGALTRSADGQYLSIAGYNAANATAAVNGAAANADRVYSLVPTTGNVNMNVVTAGSQATTYAANNIRSVVALDASQAYISGTGSGTSNGVRFIDQTGPVNNRVSSLPTNIRNVNIFNNKVYFSSASGANIGINTFDLALPTTTDSATTSLLFGATSGTGTPSPYDFVFVTDSLCYVSDDRTAANGGGIQKWVKTGTTWAVAYTLNLSTALTPIGMRGLAGEVNGDSIDLYAISADGTPRLVGVTDTLSAATVPASAVVSVLDTAAAGTVFRGVEIIPAPGSIALMALGGLLVARRRR